jgi:hypothetical protein
LFPNSFEATFVEDKIDFRLEVEGGWFWWGDTFEAGSI